MSTLSLSPRSKILGVARFTEALPHIIQLFEYIENWSKQIGADNIQTSGVGTSEIADNAVTQAKAADGVGKVYAGIYTGDGTANREINIGGRAKFVFLFRGDNSMEFITLGDATTFILAGYRNNVGNWTGTGVGDNDWQGSSTNGFKLGASGTGGLSNASGQSYGYFAIR